MYSGYEDSWSIYWKVLWLVTVFVSLIHRSMTHHFSFMHRRGPVDLFLEFYQALIVSSLNLWPITLVCLFSLRCRWTTAYLIYWLSFNCLFVFSHKFISHHSCFACFSLIECAADPKPSYRMACHTCFLFSENQPLFLKQSANRYRYRITKVYAQIQNNKIQNILIA